MMLVIGSVAAQKSLAPHQWYIREPKDLDVVLVEGSSNVAAKALAEHLNLSLDILWTKEGEPLYELMELEGALNSPIEYASSDALFALKTAHRFLYHKNYEITFNNLMDYSCMARSSLTSKYGSLAERYSEFLKEQIKQKYPTLKGKTKKAFFTDKVPKLYDHDWLHEVVAYTDKPMYLRCKDDEQEVFLNKKKWDELSEQYKVMQVLEEAYVLALERCIIPATNGGMGLTQIPAFSPQEAFKYALARVATNITSGWFREYANRNFKLIYEVGNPAFFMERFIEAEKNVPVLHRA